jgi:hypothetical protein
MICRGSTGVAAINGSAVVMPFVNGWDPIFCYESQDTEFPKPVILAASF